MRKLQSILTLVIGLAIIVGIVWVIIWYRSGDETAPVAKVEPARIVDIRPMLKLCSVEIYEDVPVRAHIGKRHLFGRMTLTGSITFDIENIESRWAGDTLMVTMPREKVEIYESTAPGSYKVIDTWHEGLFGSSNFTTAEENVIKRKVVEAWRDSIYSRGYVKRAREEGTRNLKAMLLPFAKGKEVVVKDTIPQGNFY